jgi:hypothetical protein
VGLDAILGAVASSAEVERSLRSLSKRLADASPEPGMVPRRTILCVLPDLQAAFRGELKDSKLTGIKKAPTTAETDVRITARSDDLVAMIDGRLSVAFAFLTGKIRIEAPPKDLMMIRRLF